MAGQTPSIGKDSTVPAGWTAITPEKVYVRTITAPVIGKDGLEVLKEFKITARADCPEELKLLMNRIDNSQAIQHIIKGFWQTPEKHGAKTTSLELQGIGSKVSENDAVVKRTSEGKEKAEFIKTPFVAQKVAELFSRSLSVLSRVPTSAGGLSQSSQAQTSTPSHTTQASGSQTPATSSTPASPKPATAPAPAPTQLASPQSSIFSGQVVTSERELQLKTADTSKNGGISISIRAARGTAKAEQTLQPSSGTTATPEADEKEKNSQYESKQSASASASSSQPATAAAAAPLPKPVDSSTPTPMHSQTLRTPLSGLPGSELSPDFVDKKEDDEVFGFDIFAPEPKKSEVDEKEKQAPFFSATAAATASPSGSEKTQSPVPSQPATASASQSVSQQTTTPSTDIPEKEEKEASAHAAVQQTLQPSSDTTATRETLEKEIQSKRSSATPPEAMPRTALLSDDQIISNEFNKLQPEVKQDIVRDFLKLGAQATPTKINEDTFLSSLQSFAKKREDGSPILQFLNKVYTDEATQRAFREHIFKDRAINVGGLEVESELSPSLESAVPPAAQSPSPATVSQAASPSPIVSPPQAAALQAPKPLAIPSQQQIEKFAAVSERFKNGGVGGFQAAAQRTKLFNQKFKYDATKGFREFARIFLLYSINFADEQKEGFLKKIIDDGISPPTNPLDTTVQDFILFKNVLLEFEKSLIVKKPPFFKEFGLEGNIDDVKKEFVNYLVLFSEASKKTLRQAFNELTLIYSFPEDQRVKPIKEAFKKFIQEQKESQAASSKPPAAAAKSSATVSSPKPSEIKVSPDDIARMKQEAVDELWGKQYVDKFNMDINEIIDIAAICINQGYTSEKDFGKFIAQLIDDRNTPQAARAFNSAKADLAKAASTPKGPSPAKKASSTSKSDA